ncbi:MAG: magnesium/cobalt transporter CorA [Acidobacteriota bacterium]
MLRVLRHADGRTESIAPDQIDLASPALYWIDLERSTDSEERILSDLFHFHPLAIEDCVQDLHHPKMDDYGEYVYLVLHGVRVREGETEFSSIELDVFLGPNYLLTYHHDPMRSISEMWDKALKAGPHVSRGADLLLHSILDTLVSHYFPVFEEIEQRANTLEEEVFQQPTQKTLEGILRLKRDVLHIKRIAGPQRDVLARVSRGEVTIIPEAHVVYFRDLYDHLFRLADIADSYRDMLQGAQDAYLSAVANRQNEIMKALTLVSTMMLPMTVVVGVYGMNFEHMPELHWRYGYPMALGLMLFIGGSFLTWFKLKRWL